MTTLRDVAERAGVSLATASRVVTGSARVRAETRERVERAMRDLLYVPPGARPDGRYRPARSRARESDLPRARPGDRDARDRGGLRLDPLQHDGRGLARGRLRAHAARPPGRRDDLHLQRDDRPARRPQPLRAARRARAPGSSSSTAPRRARRPVGRRRRARGRRDRDTSICSSSARRIGFVAGAGLPARPAEGGGPRRPLARPASTPDGLVAHARLRSRGRRAALRELLDRDDRRPASSARAT